MAALGTCQCCGEEKVLNDRQLCPNCRTAQACAVHADLLTMQRCAYCRKPSCAYCIENRLCQACRDAGHEAPERENKAEKKAAAVAQSVERARLLKLGGVLFVALIGNYWWFYGAPPSADDICRERLTKAQGVAMSYVLRHRVPPKTLAEIRAAAKAEKVQLPLMIPEGCRPIPDAVVYSNNGKQYVFKTYDSKGELFKDGGQVMVMTAP